MGGVQEDEGRVGGRQLKESGLASAAAANSGGNEGLDVLSPLSDKEHLPLKFYKSVAYNFAISITVSWFFSLLFYYYLLAR